MSTYQEMQVRIADELIDTAALSTAQIKLAILSAVNQYAGKEFYFNTKKEGTFSTVASQEYYTSAALADIPNISQIDAVTVTVSTYKRLVTVVDFASIDAMQSNAFTGVPSVLALYNQKLRLYPMPDAVYTVTMAYIYKLTALAADSDTNAWTEEANGETLIRQAAKRILAEDILHADEIAVRCERAEMRALDALEKETARRWKADLKYPAMPVSASAYNIYTDR